MSDRKVYLATFVGGTGLFEFGNHVFVRGVQYEVSKKLADQLAERSDIQIVNVKPGADGDDRPPEVENTPPEYEPGDELPETPVGQTPPPVADPTEPATEPENKE